MNLDKLKEAEVIEGNRLGHPTIPMEAGDSSAQK